VAELVSLAPWAVVLIVFIGMAALQWRVIGALDQALARTVPTPVPKPAPVTVAPPPPLPAPKPAAPSGPFARPWFHRVFMRPAPIRASIAISRWRIAARQAIRGARSLRMPCWSSPASPARARPRHSPFAAIPVLFNWPARLLVLWWCSGAAAGFRIRPCRLLPRRGRFARLDARRQRKRHGADRGATEVDRRRSA
jgi:hypothetical protein